MKLFNFGTLLLAMAGVLLAWGAYDYVANQPINSENCGVKIAPKDSQVAIPAFTASNRVTLKLINRSGRPIKIVGNNACWGLAIDFGSKSMPITIENEEYEFDLLVSTIAAGKIEPEFNLFLDVKDVLVIFPVKFEITVEPKQGEQEQVQ